MQPKYNTKGLFISRLNGLAMTANSIKLGSGVSMQPIELLLPNQIWIYTKENYILLNTMDDFVLDIREASKSSGTPVILYTKNDGNNQKWKFSRDGGIQSLQGTFIEILNENTSCGGAVTITNSTNQLSQMWQFIEFDKISEDYLEQNIRIHKTIRSQKSDENMIQMGLFNKSKYELIDPFIFVQNATHEVFGNIYRFYAKSKTPLTGLITFLLKGTETRVALLFLTKNEKRNLCNLCFIPQMQKIDDVLLKEMKDSSREHQTATLNDYFLVNVFVNATISGGSKGLFTIDFEENNILIE
jgi:hypothetical protein